VIINDDIIRYSFVGSTSYCLNFYICYHSLFYIRMYYGMGRLTWSVDASFAVHKDMRSHTGAVLSLGQGAFMSMSLKQKIYTKSSTEAKLVAVDDAMNFAKWIQLFVEEQTKSLEDRPIIKKFGLDTVIQQDNTSTIQLENNGQASCTKRTRHINIRYFYVTSKIKEGSIPIIYHPTKQMVSDYLRHVPDGFVRVVVQIEQRCTDGGK
jgi:hypothetical protein